MNSTQALLDLIRKRRSIRKFKPEPVPQELLRQLVELAAWAPSAGNRQDWFFTIVVSPKLKQEMAELVRRRWAAILAANQEHGFIEEVKDYIASFADFESVPVIMVVSARKMDSLQKHLLGEAAQTVAGSATSAAMAGQNLMLAAHALGLGSCCMTGALAAREELNSLLSLGKKQEIICLIALGWPAESPSPPARKSLEKIARFFG